MRDYALTRAMFLEQGTGAFNFRSLMHNIKARRRVALLLKQDDHMLDDIGVLREEVAWAAALPLSVNASLALEDRALRRERAQNARR